MVDGSVVNHNGESALSSNNSPSAALAQGKGPAAPAVKILEYQEMELFFVSGESDAP
jgi:hypothetical protein